MPPKIMWKDVSRAIDLIETTETFDNTFVILENFVEKAGGTSLLLGQVVNPVLSGIPLETYGRSNWPKEYLQEWLTNDYVIHDPITQFALRASAPFDWSDAYDAGTDFGKKVLDRAKGFGLVSGVSIPIRTETLPLGISSIGYDEELSDELIELIELVSIHAYSHALSLRPNREKHLLSELSKREVDILTYTAAGKTTWEISVILGIADTTVKTHIRNILAKLNTSNKTHAVMKGIKSGQIVL